MVKTSKKTAEAFYFWSRIEKVFSLTNKLYSLFHFWVVPMFRSLMYPHFLCVVSLERAHFFLHFDTMICVFIKNNRVAKHCYPVLSFEIVSTVDLYKSTKMNCKSESKSPHSCFKSLDNTVLFGLFSRYLYINWI